MYDYFMKVIVLPGIRGFYGVRVFAVY